MSKAPKISEAEWGIMETLWARSPLTANQVVEALAQKTDWAPNTVKTLLNRLVKKQALGFEKQGREYLYFPLADQATCLRQASASFLERFFGGSLSPMLTYFAGHRKLTRDEIASLRQWLEQQEEE